MKIIITLLLLVSSNIFSQSLDETIQWISRNSGGREQVSYDKKESKVLFLSVRDFGQQAVFVNEVDIYDVKSVSFEKGKDGWNNITINFSLEGATVKYYTVDSNFALLDKVNSIRKAGHTISIKGDKDLLNSFKKAYIHLFRSIGVPVKDGNLF